MRKLARRAAPAALVAVFYFGILVYPLLRCLWLTFPSWQPGEPTLLLIMVGPIVARLAYEVRANAFTRTLSALSLTWLGCCFILFSFTIIWELTNVFFSWPPELSGAILLTAAGLTCAGGFDNAQRIAVRTHELRSSSLDSALRIVQISDVHLGSRRSGFLRRVVKNVNEQTPSLVLITGDLIDFADMSDNHLAPLRHLSAPAVFSIGNHERYVDLEAIVSRLQDLDITVLRNRSIEWAGLQIVGIDDAEDRTQVARELTRIEAEPNRFRVLMYHRPDGAEAAAEWGIDLMLTGHTHNGQIVPFNWLVKRIFPRIRGEYPIGTMHLFVSPGTGTWGPVLRLGSKNEVTVFDLLPADTT